VLVGLVEKGRSNALAHELPPGCLLLSLMGSQTHRSRGEMCSLVSCAKIGACEKACNPNHTLMQLRILVFSIA